MLPLISGRVQVSVKRGLQYLNPLSRFVYELYTEATPHSSNPSKFKDP